MSMIHKRVTAQKYCSFNYECKTGKSGYWASLGIKLCSVLGVMVFAMLIVAGQAHSFETQMISAGDRTDLRSSSFKNSAPSMKASDPCSPFLGSVSLKSSARYDGGGQDMVMDRTRRNAGKAAALGMMFGLRFALEPVRYKTAKTAKLRRVANEDSHSSPKASALQFDVWSADDVYRSNRSALAVSAYRQCQKERALKALRAR
jgi:hypothetical protein